jgi:transposase-like protein
MNSEARRKFARDFKRNAVLLCGEPGRSVEIKSPQYPSFFELGME